MSFSKNYLEAAKNSNFGEMTQPDSPRSPTQKYRLTELGKQILESKNLTVAIFATVKKFGISEFRKFVQNFRLFIKNEQTKKVNR
ncbi:MAG: Fic family protein [Candidatus Riflebacteria bacterium]